MSGRVHCALYGHEWSDWRNGTDLPTRSRACERCHRFETVWIGGFKPQWQTRPPAIQPEPPTVLMRVWAAVLALSALIAAGARWAARIAATATRWALAACKRLGPWLARLRGAASAAARTFRDGMSRDRGEP